MKQFKVYLERKSISVVVIEANSSEEAEEIATTEFYDLDWKDTDCSDSSEVLIGETEEV